MPPDMSDAGSATMAYVGSQFIEAKIGLMSLENPWRTHTGSERHQVDKVASWWRSVGGVSWCALTSGRSWRSAVALEAKIKA